MDSKRDAGEEPVLSRSAMHSHYGGVARLVFELLFGPIHYPEAAAKRIRELSRKGTIVYVARAPSSLLALYFNRTLARLGLPLATLVAGVNLLLWQPIDRLWKLWLQRRRPLTGPWRSRFSDRPPTRSEAAVADVALRAEPIFVFLPAPRPAGGTGRTQPNDYVRALVAAQRVSDQPIFLVPHVLTHHNRGGPRKKSLTDRLFGDRRNPGRLRRLSVFLGSMRQATVRVGQAINLMEMCDAHPQADDELLARMARHEVSRRIDDEERVVAGPKLPHYETVVRRVLRDPEVQAEIETATAESDKPEEHFKRLARSHLRSIAARYSLRWLWIGRKMFHAVINRIYDGIVVDIAGLERLAEAIRRGPVVICPSHRSHIDYLIVTYVLWLNNIAPPHIAAGANLSFFPFGTIFRGCGAFFLRRTFREDPLYAATFRAYVRDLVRTGTSIEIFLEGTRSRTGKVSMPRFGILGTTVDAWRAGARDDVQFFPCAVDYERIVEARSYERELRGGQKRKETLGEVLRATKVLRSRHGRALLQFGEPISLAELAARRDLPQSNDAAHDPVWRDEVERLGYRILHRVSNLSSVTPTSVVATALLSHRGRGIAQDALLERSERIIEYLDAAAARISDTLLLGENRRAALLAAINKMVDEGGVEVDRPGRFDTEPIFRVPEDNRVALDFYKNALVNYFAPAAILARCILRHTDDLLDWSVLQQDTRFLSRLFKREFLYPVEVTFGDHFTETLTTLAVRGLVDAHEDGRIAVRDRPALEVLASLLDSFVEAYWVTTRTLADLHGFPLWERELRLRALDRCRRAFLEGEIRRPEAANNALVKSSLGWLKNTNVIETFPAGKRKDVRLTAEYSDPAALQGLIDDIGRYL